MGALKESSCIIADISEILANLLSKKFRLGSMLPPPINMGLKPARPVYL